MNLFMRKSVHPLATQSLQPEKSAPTVGVEPTTFGLEVQRASPLRHAGLRKSVNECIVSL